MIKKFRVKFLIITMSVILAVFTVIFGVTCFFFNKTFIQDRQSELESLSTQFTQNSSIDPRVLYLICNKNTTENKITVLSMFCQTQIFPKDTVEKIIKNIDSSRLPVKSVDSIYFITTKMEENILVVGINAEQPLNNLSSQVNSLLFTLSAIYVVLLIIVFSVSYQLFKPIEETFIKQKQFISDASHELKTPIAVISANSDVLGNSIDSKYLDSIKSQTERLKSLVNDLLTLSKIDEGKINLEKTSFSLSKEIELLALTFEAVAFENGKTLNIDIDKNIDFIGDLESVKKITSILLDNALKHSDTKGVINVYLKKEGGKPKLTVYNTGSEIDNENSDKLFERFYRGDNSRSRQTGGSGLGLSIAKSIADINKWKISANSVKNVSMTITVIF